MSGSAWDCDRGYVAFLKATYPLSPSGLMDGAMGYVTFLKATWPMSPSNRVAPDAGVCHLLEDDIPTVAFWFPRRHKVCRLLSSAGLKPGRPSPSPSFAPLLSPSLSLALSELPSVLGCLPRVEAAVLRRVTLHSCRGRVHAVRCEEETAKPTRRPQWVRSSRREAVGAYVAFSVQRQAGSRAEGKTVVRTVAYESLAELSWLVWDTEDSLEFYPAQASQSFFSLPRSLRPRNRESSQQRQGARRAEETGR
ncbi:hypothetical protein Taro_005861 [Colocasia esculenta]|uniref:Uncharacterized protein n=1 Tax=Colocasia esculenta TaxID=4460 RepID=A0A843TQY9_COLES|nr:hypothetical protein [Colocasia esculenta]